MASALLRRGMIVGLIAGLLVFGVARVFGEPMVDRAIAFETAEAQARAAAERAAGHPVAAPEEELVSRANQAGPGLFTGTVVYGAAFGGLFALVFAAVHGRVGAANARTVTLLLAVGGFLAAFVVPDLKYPSNPPSVGLPETIGLRTGLYVAMLACSVGGLVGAVGIRQRLLRRHGAWNAGLLGAAFYVCFTAVVMLILPAVQEVPAGFDAVVLWRFRMASALMQLVLWATLGLGFGALAERVIEGRRGWRGGTAALRPR